MTEKPKTIDENQASPINRLPIGEVTEKPKAVEAIRSERFESGDSFIPVNNPVEKVYQAKELDVWLEEQAKELIAIVSCMRRFQGVSVEREMRISDINKVVVALRGGQKG